MLLAYSQKTIKNPVLQKTFTIDEIERLESGRNKSISCNKNRFAGNGIQIRIRKLANLIARADINVISEVKNISSKLQLNGYVHSFLDNFIFGNAALVAVFTVDIELYSVLNWTPE